MSFNFDKLAPPPLYKRFKICFKLFFESIPVQKTKRGIFIILHFGRQANGWGVIFFLSSPAPLAMLLSEFKSSSSFLI